jgi:hypothetical protein
LVGGLLGVSRIDAEGEITFARLESIRRQSVAKQTLPVFLDFIEPMEFEYVVSVGNDMIEG